MNIIKPDIPKNTRIICVSDIHGNCSAFKRLLQKCGYSSENDWLFILGDIAEKGNENIASIQYVKKLCENPQIICIKGNNDTMCPRMAYKDDKEKFFSRLKGRPINTYIEMGKALGIEDFSEDFEEKRQRVNEKFGAELDFLQNLPLCIETKHHIFAHAGIENRPDWENTSESFALTAPWYLRLEHCAEKTVVCGHYPTYNFRRGNNTDLPIIDPDKRIIDIDGGASTKYAGQLNAFIITYKGNSYSYDTVYVPLGEERRVKRTVRSDRKPVYVDWENHTIAVIDKEKDFLYAENEVTKERGFVPEAFTGEWGQLHSWIHLNSFLSVNEGEHFWVYTETLEYFFGIAENAQVGFVPKDCIE